MTEDSVHEKMVLTFAGLIVDGWMYQGFHIGQHHRRRREFYSFRFEKLIIDKLAGADVKVWRDEFHSFDFDLRDFVSTRLREVEIGLGKIRHQEMAREAA